MDSSNNTIYQTPPLAGRPPFATDDDHLYENQPQTTTRRLKQPKPEDPNARTSAYNVYDNYLEGSNRDSDMASLGKGLMNGQNDDPFDDSHRPSTETIRQQPIPLAAPKPGYAAPVSALNLQRPSPAASPEGRQPSPQMAQVPKPLTLVTNMNIPPPAAIAVPSTPHPLPPTMTPIKPVFALPGKAEEDRDVKFAASSPILRGNKEETLLPRRGERGDDFWRRFSMVVHQESSKRPNEKTSAWLRKTQDGSTRLSRWVWIIGMLLLCCIAGGIGIGWYISHNDKSHDGPTALGGSAEEKLMSSSAAAVATDESGATTTSYHVSPTHTVAKRDTFNTGAIAAPSGTPLPFLQLSHEDASHPLGLAQVNRSLRHKRIGDYLNRLD